MPSAALLRQEIERSLAGRFPAALTHAPRTIRKVAPTGIAQVDGCSMAACRWVRSAS